MSSRKRSHTEEPPLFDPPVFFGHQGPITTEDGTTGASLSTEPMTSSTLTEGLNSMDPLLQSDSGGFPEYEEEEEEEGCDDDHAGVEVAAGGKKKPGNRKGWLRDEHIRFLLGVLKFGRGNWKKISTMVQTKTPKQVQSHAQKHFLRQAQRVKNKRSIHDFSLEDLTAMLRDPAFRERIVLQMNLSEQDQISLFSSLGLITNEPLHPSSASQATTAATPTNSTTVAVPVPIPVPVPYFVSNHTLMNMNPMNPHMYEGYHSVASMHPPPPPQQPEYGVVFPSHSNFFVPSLTLDEPPREEEPFFPRHHDHDHSTFEPSLHLPALSSPHHHAPSAPMPIPTTLPPRAPVPRQPTPPPAPAAPAPTRPSRFRPPALILEPSDIIGGDTSHSVATPQISPSSAFRNLHIGTSPQPSEFGQIGSSSAFQRGSAFSARRPAPLSMGSSFSSDTSADSFISPTNRMASLGIAVDISPGPSPTNRRAALAVESPGPSPTNRRSPRNGGFSIASLVNPTSPSHQTKDDGYVRPSKERKLSESLASPSSSSQKSFLPPSQ